MKVLFGCCPLTGAGWEELTRAVDEGCRRGRRTGDHRFDVRVLPLSAGGHGFARALAGPRARGARADLVDGTLVLELSALDEAGWADVERVLAEAVVRGAPRLLIGADTPRGAGLVEMMLAGGTQLSAVLDGYRGELVIASRLDTLAVDVLDAGALARLEAMASRPGLAHAPGSGAAAGLALVLAVSAPRAILRYGWEIVFESCELESHLRWADVAVAVDERFDAGAVAGDASSALALRALVHGVPTSGIFGAVEPAPVRRDRSGFVELHGLEGGEDTAVSLARAIAPALDRLAQAG